MFILIERVLEFFQWKVNKLVIKLAWICVMYSKAELLQSFPLGSLNLKLLC